MTRTSFCAGGRHVFTVPFRAKGQGNGPGLLKPLDAERAFFHHAARTYRNFRVELCRKSFAPGVRIVELPSMKRAVRAAKTRPDAPRIDHRRETVRTRNRGTRRTDPLTGSLSAMCAHDRHISPHFEPVHKTSLPSLVRIHARNVVFKHTGKRTLAAPVAKV